MSDNNPEEEIDIEMQVSKGVGEEHLEELEVTDGKDRDAFEEEVKKVKELEELLGMPQMNPYGTLNREIFRRRLDDSSGSDLTTGSTTLVECTSSVSCHL